MTQPLTSTEPVPPPVAVVVQLVRGTSTLAIQWRDELQGQHCSRSGIYCFASKSHKSAPQWSATVVFQGRCPCWLELTKQARRCDGWGNNQFYSSIWAQ